MRSSWASATICAVMILGVSAPSQALPKHGPATARSEAAAFTAMNKKRLPAIRVSIKGLPKQVKARVTVRGPKKYKRIFTRSTTAKKLRPGTYRIKARQVRVNERTATATVRPTKLKLGSGDRKTVRVTYRQTTPPRPGPTPPTPPAPLRFDLSRAVGVALPASGSTSASGAVRAASATASGLLAVAADGTTTPAITSGAANIRHAVIGPDNNVYVEYDVTNGFFPEGCLLGRIDRATGVPTCLVPAVQPDGGSIPTINWPPAAFQQNPPMQFDALGRVYYSGLTQDPRNMGWFLRRNDNGQVTDMINANMQPEAWLVLPNGSILMRGTTTDTQQRWFRRILPSGAIETPALDPGTRADGLLAIFPNGNAFVGVSNFGNPNLTGVMQFDTSSGSFSPQYWMAKPSAGQPATTHDITSQCMPPTPAPFCSSSGSSARSFVTTSDQRAFALVGKSVVQYYPQPVAPDVPLESAVIEAAGPKVALSGTDTSGRNVTGLLNPEDGSFEVLLPAIREIEVYHLRYLPESNVLMFDGLRFADGRYVIGRIDLASKSTQLTPSDKLSDFQVF